MIVLESDEDSDCVLVEPPREPPRPDIVELFSPPRLTARALSAGLLPGPAFDLLSGCDLSTVEGRASVWSCLEEQQPEIVVTSAPCTMYSALNRINVPRMDKTVYLSRRAAADSLLFFSLTVCTHQYDHGRYFLHEHPATADSWKLDFVLNLSRRPGVFVSTFDQCNFGLRAPYSGQPCRKRTSFSHNMPAVEEVFGGKLCHGDHDGDAHRQVEGSVWGVRLSTYCQVYGPHFCAALLEAFRRQLHAEPPTRGGCAPA